MLARILLWRLLGFTAFLLGVLVVAWLLHGGPGAALRGHASSATAAPAHVVTTGRSSARQGHSSVSRGRSSLSRGGSFEGAGRAWGWVHLAGSLAASFAVLALLSGLALLPVRLRARRQRQYVRLRVEPYRTDRTSVEGVVAMFEALHKRVQRRWWRRLLWGQPSVALEVHHVRGGDGSASALLAVACPLDLQHLVGATLRSAYPNCAVAAPEDAFARGLTPARSDGGGEGSAGSDGRGHGAACEDAFGHGLTPARSDARGHELTPARSVAVVRLKKHAGFIRRVKQLDRYELAREPPMDRLLNVMGACGEEAFVQLALTPAPALFERYAKRRYKRHEDHLSRERREHVFMRDRSLVEEAELRGGLEVQHRPLYFADIRVGAPTRGTCERIASELRAEGAENRLVERGTAVRQGLLGLYARRLERGEGNPWPSPRKGVYASTELASLWHLPSIDYGTVPFARRALPLAPAPPAIMRPRAGAGLLRDALGAVAIHPELRRQNTAVPGAVEQGKSSYLVATVAEDLRRERCAVIVLDPKGDAAEAAVSLVAPERTCTLLDFAHPTCGFNPLAVNAPADVIADYVVGALKHLFTDSDIRASSDRYLRNAIIAVLAHDPRSSLWDAARLLSVGEEGYAYRARVGAHVRTLPEFKEIAQFFTAELAAQLADSRSTTTAKLDAPVNKLARLLNSPSIKRVLLNDSLRVDFDRVIAGCEVLVVKGALGSMGAGNTSVLMQLLVGMLDAALARQQDTVVERRRVAVALKVDEAPLVLNRGFAETLALKRSAGLETVACWQTDAQWTEREVRDQLDALFAHRVYFATASVPDARAAASLMMAEFSDTVRPEMSGLSALGHPDARLHLPKHHAIASWCTPEGRQSPFVAQTIPLRVDRERLRLHAARQAESGGRYLSDLSQPHWERREEARAKTAHSQSAGTATSPGDEGEHRGTALEPRGGDAGERRGTGLEPRLGDEGEHRGTALEPRGGDAGERRGTGLEPRLGDEGEHRGAALEPRGGDAGERRGTGLEPRLGDEGEYRGASLEPRRGADEGELLGIVRAGGGGDEARGRGASVPRDGGERAPEETYRRQRANEQSEVQVEGVGLGSGAGGVGVGSGLGSIGEQGEGVSGALHTPLPATPAESYAELVGLDGAHSVRWTRPPASPRPLDPDPLDLEILALLATMRHVLTSQIHRRFNAERNITTTQRRLKRLSDAGLVGRFQFHRRDGGGAPMCYVIAPPGLKVLGDRGRLDPAAQSHNGPRDPASKSSFSTPLTALPSRSTDRLGDRRSLRQARHEVHVTGWALALEHALGGSRLKLRGPEESVLSPPLRSTSDGRSAIGPADLRLPGGRTPHNFLRTDPPGARIEVERFETVRPHVSVEVSVDGIAVCLLVELDDRLPSAAGAAKLERYDHLLAGWSVCAPRFAGSPIGRTGRVGPHPLVVFLCRNRPRARECARGADHVLGACRAYAGEYPRDWEYPGRERIVFASERDIHEGLALAHGVPRLPPQVRAADAPRDPSAGEATCELRELLPGAIRR